MDAKPSQHASEPLNYQTWFLKVSIHCEGCRRQVKKVLKRIDGVFTATIDPQQHKVTVTGSVGVETLLKKLIRAGKQAEIWPENLNGDGKVSGKGQNKKKNEARKPQSLENKETENATASMCKRENKSSSSNNSPEKSTSGDQVPPEGGLSEGGSGKKKKKKKVQSGGGNGSRSCLSSATSTGAPADTGLQFQDLVGPQMGQVNVNTTCQQSFSQTGYPPMVYVATNDRFYPSFYVPYLPNMCAGLDHEDYHFQSAALVSFEIFSDENANGCSLM